jgi:hypothetical protein
MKYQVTKRCVVKGSTWNVGDIVESGKDFDESQVNDLMGMRRMVPYAEPEKTEDRSIGLGEDKPRRRTRKKAD